MKLIKLLMGACCALVLVACSGEPRIDASSMQALEASINEVSESLSAERQAQFEMAMMNFMMSTGVNEVSGASESGMLREIRSGLHRKTAEDVIREYGQ